MSQPLPYGVGRVSAQRRRIAEVVAGYHVAFTVEDLARELHDRGQRSGLSTIYRAVATMDRSGYIERVGSREGSTLYVRCGRHGHHHHLVCTECGSVAHAGCPLDEIAARAASDTGFTITEHEVVLYGLCPVCAPPGLPGGRG